MKTNRSITRRAMLVGVGSLALSGCMSVQEHYSVASPPPPAPPKPMPKTPPPLMYASVPDEPFPIPAVKIDQLDKRFWRADVEYQTAEKPGTLIVDTPAKYLYHVQSNGRATRYGIGVGREGFAWAGAAHVAYKRKWPRWTPPNDMVARQPELQPYSIANGGMGPGLRNPLGARALYIHQGNTDTFYRLHGTPEAFSIGKAVSSGCIRLLNQDVIHLHDHVRDGSKIVVLPDPTMSHLMVA